MAAGVFVKQLSLQWGREAELAEIMPLGLVGLGMSG